MSLFSIIVADTQATPLRYALPINTPTITGVKLSTALPGGDTAAGFRYWAVSLDNPPPWLKVWNQVTFSNNTGYCWAGRIEDILAHEAADGVYFDVKCGGYGVAGDDQIYGTGTNTLSGKASDIVAAVQTASIPQVGATSITDTGYSLASSVTLRMGKAYEAINWAQLLGNTAKDQLIWTLYADDTADASGNPVIRLTFGPRPAAATVYIRKADWDVKEFGIVAKRLYNRVYVQYTTTTAGDTVGGPYDSGTLQGPGPGGWNFVRTARFYLPQLTNSADANQVGNALLAQLSQTRMGARGRWVCHPRPGMLLNPTASGFTMLDPCRLRAGVLVQVLDVVPDATAVNALVYNNSFMVAGSEYDEDTNTLTVIPEAYDMGYAMVMGQFRNLFQGRVALQAA